MPPSTLRSWSPARSRVVLLVACAAGSSAIAGCPRKADPTPPTLASPGVERRTSVAPARSERRKAPAAPARVHPMRAGEELGGPNATGKPGDWVIENDEVVFVVDALGGGAGFAESGGNVVDAADAKTRRDELGQLFTYFGAFPRQGVYTRIDARVEADGTAVVACRGRELYDASIAVATELRLGAGDRALLLRTTLTNEGGAKVTGLGLGDAIQWGGTEKLAPGKPVGFKGPSKGPFVGGVGRFASYAITSTDGEIAAISGGAWTDTEQRRDVELAPGASVTYERAFVVGERPDVASLVSELTLTSGGDVGAVEVALTDAKGAPVKVAAGAKVVLGTEASPDVLSLVATRDGEIFGGEVPLGKWLVAYAPSAGRRGDGARVAVEVKKGTATRATLAVTEAGSIALGPCVEAPPDGVKGEAAPLPCKLTIEGLDGTAAPDFGPAHVAGLAKNVVTLRPSEALTVPLPRGRYRVTASRGPAYDLAPIEIAVPGAAPPPFALRRVVDTAGYVGADFHQHSILSADAPVATRDRVLANAAEGVEVAVASEHNAVADLAPLAKELGVAAWLVQIAGDELTSDASKRPFGHANVFPVTPRPNAPRGGAPPVRDRLAAEVFAEARALPGGPHVLQINHPRSGKNGYFDQLGFDPKTGVGTAPGYDAEFDAVEVWNGRVVAHRTRVLEDYFALLRTGHPVTPIADTDTHGIVGEEPGYPRTFVRVAGGGAPLAAWDAARTEALVKGVRETRDVVLSNGPFLAVSANGAGIGGVSSPRRGVVDVKVTVTTAPWVVVDRAEVRLVRGGVPAPAPAILTPKKSAAGALVAEASFAVRAKEDDALVVIVSGTRPMRPVLSGDDSEIAPWAMSGAIWIDADGDGRALGRRR
ncbi:MAG: CehA/McbA family metallohydrolase [Labilithrix sp.]|nr:CehA/McbA family metallohydrolase [Labilithrix sp.]